MTDGRASPSHEVALMPLPGRKRPVVLGLFAFVLCAQAILAPIVFFVVLLMPGDTPIVFYGEQRVFGDVRLQSLAVVIALFALAAYVGPGLWRGSRTARHVAFSLFVLDALIAIAIDKTFGAIPFYAVICGIVGWYLYAKRNVRGFFEQEGSD